jgi:glycosyltransferase involved in cell wall biosynthesis
MINVLQIPRRFVHEDWGGVETYVLETGQRIQAMGHHVEVLCPAILTDKMKENIGGLQVTRTPYFYPYLGLSDSARMQLDKVGGNLFSFSFMRVMNWFQNIDIIHLHTGRRLGGIVRKAAKRQRIPYVITLHGGIYNVPYNEDQAMMAPTQGTFEWGKILGWWVGSRKVLDDAAAILCIGRKEQEEVLARYPDKRVEYMPNGVDVKRFAIGDGKRFRMAYNIPEKARLLITVARIAPPKNQMLLVKALPALLSKNPDVHVAFVGSINDTEYNSEILKTAESLGVSKAMTIVPGLQPEDQLLIDAYHAADVFVLPSVHEPFGIVVLEAWSAGRPVIASRVGGIPDFVDDGINGILFDPNSPNDFIRAYDSITIDRGLELVKAAKKKVVDYDWNTITERLVLLYKEVIDAYLLPIKAT